MATNIKKLLSFVLALVMVLSMIPAVYAAEEPELDAGVGDRTETTEPETTEPETTEPETTEPETTEPEASEPEASEPEATEPVVDGIQIGDADTWHNWFMRSSNNLIKEYAGKEETAKFVLTQDFFTTPGDLYYFGNLDANAKPRPETKVNVEIDLGGHTLTIKGTATARVFGIYSGSNLTIKNGTIILDKPFGAVNGGMFLLHSGNLTLEDVTINDIGEYKFEYNGKLMSIGSGCTATLTNTNISSNTVASTSKYNAAGALSYGIGAMIVSNGTLVANNCTFTASTTTNATTNEGLVYYGGMIGHQAGTVASYTNCTFNGGYGRVGGVLCIRAGSTTIDGCTFNNNKGIVGGAIYVSAGTTNITNTTFDGCSTVAFSGNTFGGAVAVEGGTLNISGSEMKNNTSKHGGALFAMKGTVKIADTTFEGNNATLFGGSLCISGAANTTVTNCDFVNDTSRYGGSIQVGSDDVTTVTTCYLKLEDCTITGATGTTRGGALHVYNALDTRIIMEMINTDITNCTAPVGGGIAYFGRSKTTITGGTISGCISSSKTDPGGGLYVYNGGYNANSHLLTVTDTVFDGNSASQAGNIYVGNKTNFKPNFVDLVNVTLKNGVATSPAGTDGYAGNIWVSGADLISKDGVVTRCTVNMTGCTLENGQSKYGGNLGVAGGSTVNVTDCVLRQGKSTMGGGNVYIGNTNAVINFYNTILADGYSRNGGNIRIGGGRINFFGGSIEGGDAEGIGRSIYVNGNLNAKLYIYGGTIAATDVFQPVEVAKNTVGEYGVLKILNANVEGFDPAAYVPYGEAAVAANGENAYTVKHLAVDGATTKEGTCEAAGTVTIVCPDCEHTHVYENQEGHAIVIDKAVAPTCTESGLTEGQHCALCDYAVAQETVAATGHAPAEAVRESEVPHTCTEDGSYDSVIYCATCKAELSREEGVVDPAAHTEVTLEGKAATCTENGLTEGKQCSVCEVITVAQEEIPAAHTIVVDKAVAPTCTETGLTEGEHCELCDYVVAQEEVPAAGHAWDEGVYTDPTTEADGYTTYTCGTCGETKVEVNEGSMLPPAIPAAITKQPEAITVNSGEKAVFHVEVEGEVVSYKWQYRKIWKWFDTTMEGFDTDTLTVSAKGRHNGYDYKCIITFADGTVLTTEFAELTVITTINITYHPNNQLVAKGAKGQFTVKAEGEGLEYVWEYHTPDGSRWIETSMEGNTRETVMIPAIANRDGYMYRCKITDDAGMVVYTEPATMTVLTVAEQPKDVFTAPGAQVTFTVAGSEAEGYSYQWQYYTGTRWTDTSLTGYNTATLTVSARLNINGRQYRCVLIGDKNSRIESEPATLHVGDPVVITAQPQSVTVEEGTTSVQLTVEATNVYSYQWKYSDKGATWSNTNADGSKTANLTAKVKNGRMYKCVMKGLNGETIETEIATITVIAVQ